VPTSTSVWSITEPIKGSCVLLLVVVLTVKRGSTPVAVEREGRCATLMEERTA
jgi:hypothetical protein